MPEPSEPTSLVLKVERLSLANLGGESLNEQVEAELERIHNCFTEDGESYEGRRIKAKLVASVELEYDLKTGQTSLSVSVRSQLPKRKKITRPLIMRPDGFLIEEDDEQLALYENPKRTFGGDQ